MWRLLLAAGLLILTSCSTPQSNPTPVSPTVFLINSNSEAMWNSDSFNPIYTLQIIDLNTNIVWETNTIETNQFIGDIYNSLQFGRYYLRLKEEIAFNVDSDWTNIIIVK